MKLKPWYPPEEVERRNKAFRATMKRQHRGKWKEFVPRKSDGLLMMCAIRTTVTP